MLEFHKNWMELFFLAFMIIGILIALVAPSAIISYFIAFVSGILAGRLMYERKGKLQFPYTIIILGFLIGFLIGVYYGNRRVVIVLFVLGALFSYKLYDKGVLKDTRF